MRFVVGFVVSIIISVTVLAQDAPRVRAEDQLFVQSGVPSGNTVAFPVHASFVTINTRIFDEVTGGLRNLDRIEDFPMPDGSTASLVVEEFDVLTKSSRVVAGTTSGDRNVPIPPHILLRGAIEGDDASHVYLAVFRDYSIGYIERPDEDRILITPALEATEAGDMPHIVYHQYDVDPKYRTTTWSCATESIPANQEAIQRFTDRVAKMKSNQQPQATQVKLLSLAIECDNDFYLDFGSKLASAQKYAIAVLGAMSDIYARDVNTAIKASFLRIWETEDPYTANTTEELLPQFQNYWNDNMSVPRATALLFSGNNNLGGGLAALDVLCQNDGRGYAVCGLYSNFSYPTDKYVWDSDVTSHEFGHNVGSLHTHNCAWAPPIDSCVASEGGCYSTPKPRKGTVMSYCHLTSSGTELKIHTRVANLMKQRITESDCAPTVSVPEAKAPADKIICRQSSVQLTGTVSKGTPPYEVLWFPASGPISIGLDTTTLLTVTASPTRTTSYVFRVTDANNVRAYDTVVVIIDTVIVELGQGSVTVCGSNSVTMTPASFSGRGKVTFEWRENASNKLIATGQTVTLPATDTMTYKVIATDSIGCTGTDLITILPLAGLNAKITTGSKGFCQGTIDTLDAGSGYSSYSWSTGATTRRILVSQSGTYTCIVTKSGISCTDTAQIVIVKNPVPEKPHITFEGGVLKCSLSAAYYKWYRSGNIAGPYARQSNGDTKDFIPITNGYHFVVIGNADSCETRSDTLLVVISGVDDEVPVASTVRVYPNPASKSITIDAGTGPAISHLYITDMTGKMVWSAPKMSDQTLNLSIAKWASGSYMLHYSANAQQAAVKFVKE